MSQQQRLSQEMTNTPRRCSVSKSRVGFKTDLRFPPPFSFTEGDPTANRFQVVKIFL